MNDKPRFNAATGKAEFSQILDRVEHYGEHVILQRYNKAIAVVVPIKYAEKLEQLKAKERAAK
jgi:prevent-host-death family protein